MSRAIPDTDLGISSKARNRMSLEVVSREPAGSKAHSPIQADTEVDADLAY
jgi:hypothetical protein